MAALNTSRATGTKLSTQPIQKALRETTGSTGGYFPWGGIREIEDAVLASADLDVGQRVRCGKEICSRRHPRLTT
jgi:hypothetical protein